jgi:LmbE family N-acetylglucosaminyl deacetylase
MKSLSRRDLMGCAGGLASTMALGLPLDIAAVSPFPGGPQQRKRKLKVIVTGGHPGDPEYGCGGTIARYTDLGHEVVLLYLNRGERGIPNKPPSEAGAIRTAEAEKACEILKTRAVFAGQINGEVEVNSARYDAYRKIIEREQPDVVFTHWPIDNHEDHRADSLLVYDAWVRMGKRFALYYYEVSNGEDTLHFSPTHYVNITQTEARKRAACFAHASQEPERFYGLQEQVARFRGIESGCQHAEAYIRHVQSPDVLLPLAL